MLKQVKQLKQGLAIASANISVFAIIFILPEICQCPQRACLEQIVWYLEQRGFLILTKTSLDVLLDLQNESWSSFQVTQLSKLQITCCAFPEAGQQQSSEAGVYQLKGCPLCC